jgi:hypothetical protein
VEAYVIGTAGEHDEIAGHLHTGPLHADVRSVQVMDAPMLELKGFDVRD